MKSRRATKGESCAFPLWRPHGFVPVASHEEVNYIEGMGVKNKVKNTPLTNATNKNIIGSYFSIFQLF